MLCVWNERDEGLLVDVGLTYRQIGLRMHRAGIDPAWFQAVLLTHCHGDHHHGIRLWTEHHGLPIYSTSETADRVEFLSDHPGIHVPIEMRQAWEIAGFEVTCLPVVHNAAGAVTYFLRELPDGPRLAMIFETGRITAEMEAAAAGADVLAIESNHDPRMLADNTKLPGFLVDRIAATHLSNVKCQQYLRKICEDPPRLTVLLHLSQENNTPELALMMARQALTSGQLVAADQDQPTEVYEV